MSVHPPRTHIQNRLLDLLTDTIEQWAISTPLVSRVNKATVTSVAAGGASDSNALVVINWQGGDVAASYLAGYTPVAGDVVAVAKTGASLLIVDRIIGTP